MAATIEELIEKLRVRLDDIVLSEQEFEDDVLGAHINNSLDKHDLIIPLERKPDEQLIIIEAAIAIATALKMWADGESYSYKNDAIQMTRGLMSKHYQDTIRLLRVERDDILEGNGGVY